VPAESPSPDPDIAALRLHLAKLRQARGYSYDELAARSGIARSTLVYLESGASNRNPDKPATTGTLTTWYHLARALEVPLDELLAPLLTEN
jgi:transcriptional regulator with XRE-family HTH domain